MNQRTSESYQHLSGARRWLRTERGGSDTCSGRRCAVGFPLAVMMLLALCGLATAQQHKDSCVECHSRLGGKLAEPVRQMQDNIHKARGLSCNDCHGGDPTQDDKRAAKDPRKGYLGRPQPGEI